MAKSRLPGSAPKRPVVPEDLFKLRFVMGADLSPDGGSVVYALSRSDLAANTEYDDLYVHDVEAGASRQLTDDDAMHMSPVFSPDGRSIAFLSARNGMPQIFVMPADGGEARQITSMAQGVGGGPVWSPDGSRIAFSAGPPAEPRDPMMPYRITRAVWRADGMGLLDDAIQDIYVIGAEGGEPQQLTNDAFMNYGFVWALDGESLFYVAAFDPHAPGEMRLRRVRLDGDVTDLLVAGALGNIVACPDGRIAYRHIMDIGEPPWATPSLWVLHPATGEREPRTAGLDVGVGGVLQGDLPSLLLAIGNVVGSEDGAHLFAPVQRGGELAIFKIALTGPEAYEPVAEGERVCAPIALRGDRLLFAGFGMTEPGDLYVLDTSSPKEQRLTHLNEELLGELELPHASRLEFTSSDGTAVEGWFLPPTDGPVPYPTLLGIHGGSQSGWGHLFNFDFLMLSAAGFGVLFVNQRGSSGYGREFNAQVIGDLNNLDYDDLMAGVDHAVELGLADPDRLGVFGISQGGVLTGWIIGHTDRFKAACPENPGFNFVSAYGTADTGLMMADALGGPPHEHPDLYERCSPITFAHRCTTPTLFLQHDEDHRCPPEQTEQFYTTLKAQGVTAEMLRFPGTGHMGSIIGPPSHRHAQNEAILDWMRRYVLRNEAS